MRTQPATTVRGTAAITDGDGSDNISGALSGRQDSKEMPLTVPRDSDMSTSQQREEQEARTEGKELKAVGWEQAELWAVTRVSRNAANDRVQPSDVRQRAQGSDARKAVVL